MKFVVSIFVFVLLSCSVAFGQETTREKKPPQVEDSQKEISLSEPDVLLPAAKDTQQAETQGFSVFKILPREKYERKLTTIQGGGSYYSFTSKSHDYQKIAQISLERDNLKVGFAGADYGFIADLGKTPLADITRKTGEVNFLINYKPPTNEPEARNEERKARNYEADGFSFKSRIPAVAGHSYVLRAISFRRADVLVAFKIHRRDEDGSLIIFWKLIENFEKPLLARAE